MTWVALLAVAGCARDASAPRSGAALGLAPAGPTAESPARAATRAAAPARAATKAALPQLTMGLWHTCQLGDGGTVRCSGDNGREQLGDGWMPYRTTPVRGPEIPAGAIVEASGTQTCALEAGGGVVCWGGGTAEPIAVRGLTDAVELRGSDRSMCARRRGGRVVCWQDAALVEEGGRPAGAIATTAVPGVTDAVELLANGWGTCARRRNGERDCWPYDVGAPDPPGGRAKPPVVRFSTEVDPVALRRVRARAAQEIAGGCAVLNGGEVACWGYRELRRHGAPEERRPARPRLVPPVILPDLSGVVALVQGVRHTCALERGGRVRCWGDNVMGQLGDGTAEPREGMAGVAGLDDAVEIDAGWNHTCARRKAGGVVCWGANYSGQLGDGSTVDRPAPVPVAGLYDATALAVGGAHACARRASGALACWGWAQHGELGDRSAIRAARGERVTVVGLAGVVEIAGGDTHTCARRADGEIWCWGRVIGGGGGCTPQEDGTMQCWGSGTACGSVFDGHTESHATPVRLEDVIGVAELVARDARTCARREGGGIVCWTDLHGCSESGEVRARPEEVARVPDAVELALGGAHACVRRAGGRVSCWGKNDDGQLGDGTAASRKLPADVAGLEDAVQLAAGKRHTCALRRGGKVACWGFNVSGQLGDGTTRGSRVPVNVALLPPAVEIRAGDYHTCARVDGGAVACWGENDFGSIGDGTRADRPAPVAVLGLTRAVRLATTEFGTCALGDGGRLTCWGRFDLDVWEGRPMPAIVREWGPCGEACAATPRVSSSSTVTLVTLFP